MIDLHTHSSASDGDLRPAELVEKAALAGLEALALTDHDTLSGLEEAQKAAEARHIAFIPGIELEIRPESAEKPGGAAAIPPFSGEFHLLGLGIHRATEEFRRILAHLAGARERRNREMIAKMNAAGIPVEYEDIKACAGSRRPGPLSGNGEPARPDPLSGGGEPPVRPGGTSGGEPLIGRPHFGAFLIGRRIVKNQEQAFKRWLGKGRPFYVPKEGLPFEQAARLIHQSGGAAVLAHPLSLYVSWGRLPVLLTALKDRGLDGLEAWHPTARVKACKRLEELGRRLGLYITAGSDFHGSARPERKLGYTAGNRKIGNEFLEGIPGKPGAISPG